LTLGTRFLGRCRLPTSADQFRRTGTPSSAVILARIGIASPSRGERFSCVCVMSASGEVSHPQRASWILHEGANLRATGEAGHRNPSRPTEPSEGLAHCVSSPPRVPAEHLSCRQPVAAKDLECPPPRRTSPLLLRDSDAWLARWPRSSFPRPPAKENVFQKTKVPSAVSSSFWVREDRSPRPLGLGLLVTPPYRALVLPALGSFLFIRVALRSRSTSAFFFLRAPKP